jgi:hypothetical protein
MIRCRCPRCRTEQESPDEAAGSKLPCPACGQRLQLPLPPLGKTVLVPLVPAPAIEPLPQAIPLEPPAVGPLPQATPAAQQPPGPAVVPDSADPAHPSPPPGERAAGKGALDPRLKTGLLAAGIALGLAVLVGGVAAVSLLPPPVLAGIGAVLAVVLLVVGVVGLSVIFGPASPSAPSRLGTSTAATRAPSATCRFRAGPCCA